MTWFATSFLWIFRLLLLNRLIIRRGGFLARRGGFLMRRRGGWRLLLLLLLLRWWWWCGIPVPLGPVLRLHGVIAWPLVPRLLLLPIC